jgi:hypothetical protein
MKASSLPLPRSQRPNHALVLEDAYGYSVNLPQTLGTFYANLDSTTGNVLICGGPAGASADTLAVAVSDGTLVARQSWTGDAHLLV